MLTITVFVQHYIWVTLLQYFYMMKWMFWKMAHQNNLYIFFFFKCHILMSSVRATRNHAQLMQYLSTSTYSKCLSDRYLLYKSLIWVTDARNLKVSVCSHQIYQWFPKFLLFKIWSIQDPVFLNWSDFAKHTVMLLTICENKRSITGYRTRKALNKDDKTHANTTTVQRWNEMKYY